MNRTIQIEVGDRFLAVTGDYGRPQKSFTWVRVTKVGRKWAEYQKEGSSGLWTVGRFDLEAFRIDGGNLTSPGRVYRSEEEYQASVRLAALWRDFRQQVARHSPKDLTEADLLKAADILGLRLTAPNGDAQ
jgi:hypothetical protein